MDIKKKYGQFMTTNYKYILQNFSIPIDSHIIEPFVGEGHLLNFVKDFDIECYDIDPKIDCIQQDTLLIPPDYTGKFVLTNPPYLARNKNPDKTLYEKYKANDLYKCFIKQLDKCQGGILIIPLNFFCSSRNSDLKNEFLSKYSITYLNIFEEQVFDDTSYNICSFQFEKKNDNIKTIATFYPSNETIMLDDLNFDLILDSNENVKVMRLTRQNVEKMNTNIFLHCIDSKNKIRLTFEKEPYIDNTAKLSARSFATLIIEPALSVEQQKKLIIDFNKYMNEKRTQYHSLFLTNYRDFGRKRISFDLTYRIIKHILKKE